MKPLELTPILEDPDFKSLVRNFSVFEVMGTADYEIRHSNVLAWLLDQNQTHRQGSAFLEILWKRIAEEHNITAKLSFDDYEVKREGVGEEENYDILIKAKNNDWIITIENKIFSPETGKQLRDYFRGVEKTYKTTHHRYFFYLTPGGKAPKEGDDRINWKSIKYSTIYQSVKMFLERPLPDRVKTFLEQYLENLEKKVLTSVLIDKKRNILAEHKKFFHILESLIIDKVEEEKIRGRCDKDEFDLLKEIVAIKKDVSRELFKFTKQLMDDYHIARHSGKDTWITIKLPDLWEKLKIMGLAKPNDDMPIVFALDAQPASYVADVWLYKKFLLHSKVKSQCPKLVISDEHPVAVLYRKQIINADQIIKESLQDLKNKIADYFESELKATLEREQARIGDALKKLK